MTSDSSDNSETIILPPAGVAARIAAVGAEPTAGAARNDDDADSHTLPPGTVLGDFELTGKIGEGGFSIVYLAQDRSLDRTVALKEYMPQSIAARKGLTHVSARSERHRDTFDAGLRSFVNEAKLLARFDHPSLVKVFRFWEANGTAYMVMPFYEGITLRDTVLSLPGPPDEAWLLRILGPLTEALRVIHTENCFHRDIAPDNVILLQGTGKPLLLDFGAARRVVGDMTQALTVILKPGYAPVEQYAEIPDMKQGAWTDVYALAATIYWVITRTTPPPAVGRLLSDSYRPLAEQVKGHYSEGFLEAIDRALVVRPELRTASIDTFRQQLGLGIRPDAHAAPHQPNRTLVLPTTPADKPLTVSSKTGPRQTPVPPAPAAVTGATLKAGTGRTGAVAGGIVAVAVIVGAVAWWINRPKPPLVPAAQPEPVNVDSLQRAAPGRVAEPPPMLPSTRAALDYLLATREQSRTPIAAFEDFPITGGMGHPGVKLKAEAPGFLYLVGAREGDEHLYLAAPAPGAAARTIHAGDSNIAVPSLVTLPAGDWRFIVVVSAQDLALDAGGWTRDGNALSKTIRATDTSAQPVIGKPECADGSRECRSPFGATEIRLTIPAPAIAQPAAQPTLPGAAPTSRATKPDAIRPKPETARKEPGKPSSNSAECAAVLQRMSLGDSSPELVEKLNSLNCK